MANCKFEFVSKFQDCGLALPERKTRYSAGYDLACAQDCIIPSYHSLMDRFEHDFGLRQYGVIPDPVTLNEIARFTKETKIKPTLISTGLKCKLEEGTYLELSVRSSTPLKYWIILANSVGVIDADYYNNPDNEGEIFLQVINLSPVDIQIKKGDVIGQGIIKRYETIIDDHAEGERQGGFGSTSDQSNIAILHKTTDVITREEQEALEYVASIWNKIPFSLGISAEEATEALKELSETLRNNRYDITST